MGAVWARSAGCHAPRCAVSYPDSTAVTRARWLRSFTLGRTLRPAQVAGPRIELIPLPSDYCQLSHDRLLPAKCTGNTMLRRAADYLTQRG
jgi:hypothetical protein